MTKADRALLARATLEDLVNRLRSQILSETGARSKIWLDEVSRRLGCEIEMAAIVIARRPIGKGSTSFDHYVWSVFTEENQTVFKTIEGRYWNKSVKANSFESARCGGPESLVDRLKPAFRKILVIDATAHRVVDGDAVEPAEPGYDLSEKSQDVYYADVLDALKRLRPNDEAVSIALHIEIDEEYRSLFGSHIRVDSEVFNSLGFFSRHRWLLFHVRVKNGRPRYIHCHVEACMCNLYYTGSNEAKRLLAFMKDNARKWGCPVVESPIWDRPPEQGELDHTADADMSADDRDVDDRRAEA